MRHALIAVLSTAAVWGTTASGQAPQQVVDNAVAFARLYGVVRYFYPSDASATSIGTASPFMASSRFATLGMGRHSRRRCSGSSGPSDRASRSARNCRLRPRWEALTIS